MCVCFIYQSVRCHFFKPRRWRWWLILLVVEALLSYELHSCPHERVLPIMHLCCHFKIEPLDVSRATQAVSTRRFWQHLFDFNHIFLFMNIYLLTHCLIIWIDCGFYLKNIDTETQRMKCWEFFVVCYYYCEAFKSCTLQTVRMLRN